MNIMEAINWSVLAPELLTQVFKHIPIQILLDTIPKVCLLWRNLLHQMSFWFERLEYEGISISKDHRLDLIQSIDQERIIRLLKITGYHYTLCPYKLCKHITLCPDVQEGYLDDNAVWIIEEDQVAVASIYLMFRTPKEVYLFIRSKCRDIPELDLMLIQLSYTSCEVNIFDTFSWQLTDTSTSDYLLSFVVKDNMKCKFTSFEGCVTSINLLPRSIEDLNIAITCDENGKAIDPGITKIQQLLPALRELQIHVDSSTDVSHLRRLPALRNMRSRRAGPRGGVSLIRSSKTVFWVSETAKVLQQNDKYFRSIEIW